MIMWKFAHIFTSPELTKFECYQCTTFRNSNTSLQCFNKLLCCWATGISEWICSEVHVFFILTVFAVDLRWSNSIA